MDENKGTEKNHNIKSCIQKNYNKAWQYFTDCNYFNV